MKKEKDNNELGIGTTILISSLIIAFILYISISNQKVEVEKYLPLPPCEPWDDGDYWCKPYVDWGYANGLVMAQRIVSEREMIKSLPSTQTEGWTPLDLNECRQIIKNLYDKGHSVASGEIPFRTKK